MFKLDNNFLNSLGLGSLPVQEKNKLLQAIYERLEMNVGMRLAEKMTDAQLDEFEGFIDRNDEPGAINWLSTNFPNYKQVVAEELDKLRVEVQASAPQILASSQDSMAQTAGPSQPMVTTNSAQVTGSSAEPTYQPESAMNTVPPSYPVSANQQVTEQFQGQPPQSIPYQQLPQHGDMSNVVPNGTQMNSASGGVPPQPVPTQVNYAYDGQQGYNTGLAGSGPTRVNQAGGLEQPQVPVQPQSEVPGNAQNGLPSTDWAESIPSERPPAGPGA